jgi:hypothetical protein
MEATLIASIGRFLFPAVKPSRPPRFPILVVDRNMFDWEPPGARMTNPPNRPHFQVLAYALAIGGTLWGILCLPFFFLTPLWSVLIFGPGYLVTYGYCRRALGKTTDESRLYIWGASAVVQGVWLFTAGREIFQSVNHEGSFAILALGWWTASFGISCWAFVADRGSTQGGRLERSSSNRSAL